MFKLVFAHSVIKFLIVAFCSLLSHYYRNTYSGRKERSIAVGKFFQKSLANKETKNFYSGYVNSCLQRCAFVKTRKPSYRKGYVRATALRDAVYNCVYECPMVEI